MSYNPNRHHRRSIRLKGYDYSQTGMYFITICCHNHNYRFGKIEKGKMKLNNYGEIAGIEWFCLQERFSNIRLDAFVVMPNHIHCIIIIKKNKYTGAGFTPANTLTPTYNSVGAGLAPALIGQPANQNSGINTGQIINQYQLEDKNEKGDRKDRPNDESEGLDAEGDRKGRPDEPMDEREEEKKVTIGAIIGAYKSLVFNNCLKSAKENNLYLGKFWQRDFFENIVRNEAAYKKITDYIIHNPERWEDDKFYTKD